MVDAWFGGPAEAIDEAARAQSAWLRIQRNPASIVILRGAVDLAAQTVRITHQTSQATFNNQPTGMVSETNINVFGVRDHPDVTIADTNIRIGDRFVHDNVMYEIQSISLPPGEIHATGEVTTG